MHVNNVVVYLAILLCLNSLQHGMSTTVDNTDLSIQKIFELLRTKMIDLSEAHVTSRNIVRKAKNKTNRKLLNKSPGFDAEC